MSRYRRRRNNGGNNGGVFLFLFFFFVLVTGLPNSLLWLFGLLMLASIVRNVDIGEFLNSVRGIPSNMEIEEDFGEGDYGVAPRASRASVPAEPIYRHALSAVTAAGLDPDSIPVLTVDIGVLVYAGNAKPEVYRTWKIPDDVDYLQPFVQLRLPSKATGIVRFELYDSSGDLIYAREESHALERGRNFITPSTRAPIHDQQDMEGNWELRVSADGVLLAVHQFAFGDATSATIGKHIGEDGEINTELKLAISDGRTGSMSLDDLLSYHDDEGDNEQKAPRRL